MNSSSLALEIIKISFSTAVRKSFYFFAAALFFSWLSFILSISETLLLRLDMSRKFNQFFFSVRVMISLIIFFFCFLEQTLQLYGLSTRNNCGILRSLLIFSLSHTHVGLPVRRVRDSNPSEHDFNFQGGRLCAQSRNKNPSAHLSFREQVTEVWDYFTFLFTWL